MPVASSSRPRTQAARPLRRRSTSSCASATLQYDLGAEVPVVNEPNVTYDLRLKRVAIVLTASSAGTTSPASTSAGIRVVDPGRRPRRARGVVHAPTRRRRADDDLASRATRTSTSRRYVAAGRLESRVELTSTTPRPHPRLQRRRERGASRSTSTLDWGAVPLARRRGLPRAQEPSSASPYSSSFRGPTPFTVEQPVARRAAVASASSASVASENTTYAGTRRAPRDAAAPGAEPSKSSRSTSAVSGASEPSRARARRPRPRPERAAAERARHLRARSRARPRPSSGRTRRRTASTTSPKWPTSRSCRQPVAVGEPEHRARLPPLRLGDLGLRVVEHPVPAHDVGPRVEEDAGARRRRRGRRGRSPGSRPRWSGAGRGG